VPSPFVPLPSYPIVPPLPGVPPLPTPLGGLNIPLPGLVFADVLGLGALSIQRPQWGIYTTTGQPILAVDSVFAVEYARDYRISDYPQEFGAFQSYNKVQLPYQAKVTFLISETRTDFLNAVEQACASLAMVSVITPEVNYPSANLIHYNFRREAVQGVTLVRVDVWVMEVRVTAGVMLTPNSAATPGAPMAGTGSGVISTGALTPSTITPSPSVVSGGTPANAPTAGSTSAAQSVNAQPPTNDGVVQGTPVDQQPYIIEVTKHPIQ